MIKNQSINRFHRSAVLGAPSFRHGIRQLMLEDMVPGRTGSALVDGAFFNTRLLLRLCATFSVQAELLPSNFDRDVCAARAGGALLLGEEIAEGWREKTAAGTAEQAR